MLQSEHDSEATPVPSARFRTTHWSVVLAAGQRDSANAEEALAKLCAAYWYPLYVFIRRRGYGVHEAEDLTQDFFARLLQKDFLQSVDPQKGKFRSFLLASLKNFLANDWNRKQTIRRGKQFSFIVWDDAIENRYAQESSQLDAERLFEQSWAFAVLEKVMRELKREYVAAGKAELFATLQVYLSGGKNRVPYAEVMATLNMSESAVKMSVLRSRRRFAELLRAEIAQTVASPTEVDEEVRHLFAAFNS
ncbi:MAG TPA: sigma-70 family RNA polymerase sigma factor [Verrucomicrobiae bacterium]